jgi:hypothetical protein
MKTSDAVRRWLERFRNACFIGAIAVIPGMTKAVAEGNVGQPVVVKEIDLVHFAHTDVGFTDHPSVCRELFRRYVDVAVDTVLDSLQNPPERRFYWTAESTMPVNDWWQQASPERRQDFLKAVRSGQLEIAALPFNNTPFMNGPQWQTMTHWLPEDLWGLVKPRVAIQNDVNGTPRAAGMALLDRGVRYLFTGINEDSGGSPFPRPSAFWWKMPDGRRLFVWLNLGYGSGFDFFGGNDWRRGPVPLAADARYRPPRQGELLRSDEASVRASHRLCLEQIRNLEKQGYKHEVLAVSVTSQWRIDNDPPFAPIADFVAAWNQLGLEPRLRMTTAGDAMERMEKAMGASAPEFEGEWTDWWANGSASAPREVAASRIAKRLLDAVQSPIWGPSDTRCRQTMDELYRDLCLFDEHTWGSSLSVAKPYSLDTQGQFNEKSGLAFRPMARAEWLLSQRARTKLTEEGLFLANPTHAPYSGWARMIATCLRDNYQSVENTKTGARMKLYFEPGIQPWGRPQKPEDLSREDISATFPDNAPNQVAKFWVEHLDADTAQSWRLSTEPAAKDITANDSRPEIETDAHGWPVAAVWPGMKKPLFLEGLGTLSAVNVKGFAPRHLLADIRGQRGDALEKMRREKLNETSAEAGEKTDMQETPHTLLYTQAIRHPRLQWATRVLEVWKREARARLTVRLNRLSSAAPEILYLAFPLPTGDSLPRLSNGGQPFIPFADQIPGTCRDYFAIDGWADYATADGHWLWVSRDAPLIAFGASPTLSMRQSPPKDVHRLMAMLFNNFWYTNFVADEHGIMEFQFDLVWREKLEGPPGDLAGALMSEPIMGINPREKESPRILQDLFRP